MGALPLPTAHRQEVRQSIVTHIRVGHGLRMEMADGFEKGGGRYLIDGIPQVVVADEVTEETLRGSNHRLAVLCSIAYATAALTCIAVRHENAVARCAEGVEKLETHELVLHEYVAPLFLEPCQSVVKRLFDVDAYTSCEVEPAVLAVFLIQEINGIERLYHAFSSVELTDGDEEAVILAHTYLRPHVLQLAVERRIRVWQTHELCGMQSFAQCISRMAVVEHQHTAHLA